MGVLEIDLARIPEQGTPPQAFPGFCNFVEDAQAVPFLIKDARGRCALLLPLSSFSACVSSVLDLGELQLCCSKRCCSKRCWTRVACNRRAAPARPRASPQRCCYRRPAHRRTRCTARERHRIECDSCAQPAYASSTTSSSGALMVRPGEYKSQVII